MKKRKMTDTQKHHIECANCNRCGFRLPFWGNEVEGCMFNIMNRYEMRKCFGRSKCDRYVTDTLLEKHIKSILKMPLTALTSKYEDEQKKLFDLLQNEILDLDIKNCNAEVTNVKISELAARLFDKGVVVKEDKGV